MTTNDEKKAYLRRYIAAKRRAALIQSQIDELREQKTSPSIINDGMPHAGGPSDLSGYAARFDELFQELYAEKEWETITYQQIREKIKQVDSIAEQEVLTRRYLLDQNWDDIAVGMNYAYSYVLKIHGKALIHFEI